MECEVLPSDVPPLDTFFWNFDEQHLGVGRLTHFGELLKMDMLTWSCREYTRIQLKTSIAICNIFRPLSSMFHSSKGANLLPLSSQTRRPQNPEFHHIPRPRRCYQRFGACWGSPPANCHHLLPGPVGGGGDLGSMEENPHNMDITYERKHKHDRDMIWDIILTLMYTHMLHLSHIKNNDDSW